MPEWEDESSLNINESLSRVVGFMTRRRWWIFAPACLVTLATAALVRVLPNKYKSSATLMIVQQKVPPRYVAPNISSDMFSTLQNIQQDVLSHGQLVKLVNDFDLFPKERQLLSTGDLAALMLANVEVDPVNENPQQRAFDAFTISFTAPNAVLAKQVTEKLASLFINEYQRNGVEQAHTTTSFLHEQSAAKAKELEEQEERLRDFKLRFVGELPEQQQGTLGILGGLQGQLQNTMANLNRAQQQRSLLQAQLEAATRRRTAQGPLNVALPEPPERFTSQLDAAQTELSRLETTRATLLSRGYTASHPDLAKLQREITHAEDRVRTLMASSPRPDAPRPSPEDAPASPADDPVIAQITSNLESNGLEIESLTKDQARLKTNVSLYESRLNQMPVREQQQEALARNTQILRDQYGELQKMEHQSQLATNLEMDQGGQQFRLINAATLPSRPFSPKRLQLSAAGVVGGLVLGLLLACLMEVRDTSFRRESDVLEALTPPFVIALPKLTTVEEKKQRRWMNTVEWLGASALAGVVLLAEVFLYKHR